MRTFHEFKKLKDHFLVEDIRTAETYVKNAARNKASTDPLLVEERAHDNTLISMKYQLLDAVNGRKS